jgi:hypothetical protein
VSDQKIVRAAIHPAVGVARVGDSKSDFFMCPEVPEPEPEEDYRDSTGAIKRQAVKFRLFGYNAVGEVVRELTSQDGAITWSVRLANKKAAWFQFGGALDIDETRTCVANRRNPPMDPYKPEDWIIDSNDCSLAVTRSSSAPRSLVGRFLGESVKLGEIRVVEDGRLLLLGGRGRSESPLKARPTEENDKPVGWFDDTSDGPVSATVILHGANESIPVAAAWVLVVPPNYAPGIKSWRTLFDRLEDLFIAANWLEKPKDVSFKKHILPKLQRLSRLQWVNAGFAGYFGSGAPMDFENPELIEKLAQPPGEDGSDPFIALRRSIAIQFRPIDTPVDDPRLWPWIYGDGVLYDGMWTPNTYLPLEPLEQERFKKWAEGEFVNDWDPKHKAPIRLEDFEVGRRPAVLDEAALSDCIADAFHPGYEVSWNFRRLEMFEQPSPTMPLFRIRFRRTPEPDYGPLLTQAIALAPGGPLAAQGPGDITRWLPVPWQMDIPFCRSGYMWRSYHPHLPTFWPARVPNQVLKQEQYSVLAQKGSDHAIMTAFLTRDFWLREIFTENNPNEKPEDGDAAVKKILKRWNKMGIVVPRTDHIRRPDLPAVIHVETLPPAAPPPSSPAKKSASRGVPRA